MVYLDYGFTTRVYVVTLRAFDRAADSLQRGVVRVVPVGCKIERFFICQIRIVALRRPLIGREPKFDSLIWLLLFSSVKTVPIRAMLCAVGEN